FGGGGASYQLMDSRVPGLMDTDETSLFDGVDVTLAAVAQYAGANPPAALKTGLAAVVDRAMLAKRIFDSGDDAGTVEPIEAGLAAVRSLRSQLGSMGLDSGAQYEIDYRLGLKERDFEDASIAAHGLSFDAVADDGLVVAGQPVRISLVAVNR